MFCPNCGTENNVGLNYCRSCGLKLDAIVEAVADQLPSQVDAEYLRRKEKFDRARLTSKLIAGGVGLALAVFFYTQYTNLGYYFWAVLPGAIVAWIFFFLLPALGFEYYGMVHLKPKHLPPAEAPVQSEVPASPAPTSRLIENRPSDYVSSVTEDTTDLLNVPAARGKK
jgi:hypothetical protein